MRRQQANPEFEESVARVLLGLQPGDLITYGEVAAEAGYPGAARAVGTFLRNTDLDLPWWRVVGSGGYIRSPNPDLQATRLIEEGFTVIDGRVRSGPD